MGTKRLNVPNVMIESKRFPHKTRVTMADGCSRFGEDEPVYGWSLGYIAFIGQSWLAVKWDDLEDPEFCKESCLTEA